MYFRIHAGGEYQPSNHTEAAGAWQQPHSCKDAHRRKVCFGDACSVSSHVQTVEGIDTLTALEELWFGKNKITEMVKVRQVVSSDKCVNADCPLTTEASHSQLPS